MTATRAHAREGIVGVAGKEAVGGIHAITPQVCPPSAEQLSTFNEADQALLTRILSEPLEYVDHELFHRPDAELKLFGESRLDEKECYFHEVVPVDPGHAEGEGSTLTTVQEILLFQRFNYARMRMSALLSEYAGQEMPVEVMRELLAWGQRAMMARGQITQANIPLVLAMARRTRLNGLDFNELISEGNFALLRSVDKFDCSRGFKFSTYACRAILKSFSRVAMRTSRYRGRFPTEFDPSLEKSDFIDRKRDDVEAGCVDEIREILAQNRADLNETERTVICERFALSLDGEPAKPKTLEQVGEMIGVTKERVRQIQNKALQKLRMILEEDFLAA